MSQVLRLRDPLVPVLCQTAHNHHTGICKRYWRSNYRRFSRVIYTYIFFFFSPSCVLFKHITKNAMCLFPFLFRKHFREYHRTFREHSKKCANKSYKYFNDNINFSENVGISDFLIFSFLRFFKFSWIILPLQKVFYPTPMSSVIRCTQYLRLQHRSHLDVELVFLMKYILWNRGEVEEGEARKL